MIDGSISLHSGGCWPSSSAWPDWPFILSLSGRTIGRCCRRGRARVRVARAGQRTGGAAGDGHPARGSPARGQHEL